MFTSNFVKHSTLAAGISSLIGLSSLFGASPSYAQVTNPSFETGDFTGYDTIGDASIQTEDFGSVPTDGEFQALLSTLSGTENLPFDDFTFSGVGAVRPATELEEFLDVPDRTILPANAFEGSAMKQMFTATPGDYISFDFNFLTDEDTPSITTNDTFEALLSVQSELFETCRAFFVLISGDTSSVFDLSSTPFNRETGYNTFTQQLPVSPTGEYIIEFVVVDVADELFDSGLLVDNIRFTEEPESDLIAVPGGPGDASSCSSCPPTSVPEPSSMLSLLAFGALGGRLVLKRQRKTLA